LEQYGGLWLVVDEKDSTQDASTPGGCCVGSRAYECLSRRQGESAATPSQFSPKIGIDTNRLNPIFPNIHECAVMFDSAVPE